MGHHFIKEDYHLSLDEHETIMDSWSAALCFIERAFQGRHVKFVKSYLAVQI